MMQPLIEHTTHLYLVRHGQTELNRKRIVQGRSVDPPLNAMGQDQASRLGRRAASWDLDAIYCSTLRRAGETAHFVARHCPGIPVFAMEDLEEMSWGKYEGKGSSPDVDAAMEGMHAEWSNGNYSYGLDGGESILEVQARARRAIDALMANHGGSKLLVVTHGRYLRVLLATLLSEYGLERMEELKHANTCVNHLVHAEGRFEARMLNDIEHLDSQYQPKQGG